MALRTLVCAFVLVIAPAAAMAESVRVRTPQAVQVIDGDTVRDHATGDLVRIENIDAPERGGRAKCAEERARAEAATATLRRLVRDASRIEISPRGADRYGRTLARVAVDGIDVGEDLIAQGLARAWRGRREPWCA